MFADPKSKDPLFAVAIVARPKPKLTTDPATGGERELQSPKLTLSLELIREASAVSAASIAKEQFARAYPEHDIIGHITEPVP